MIPVEVFRVKHWITRPPDYGEKPMIALMLAKRGRRPADDGRREE